MIKGKPALQTHDLSIGYRTRRKADVLIAKHLNLTLNQGKLVGLLGPNGVGKSTLLRTLAGMQNPLAGEVSIGGDALHQLPKNNLAKRLSMVLTERPNVGLMNGYALVVLGRHPYTDWMGRLSDYDEAVVRWAVDAVDAHDIANQPVDELSDGQRQKLMIARALAQETDVILLDEPTAYLDLPRRVETMGLLKHLAQETNRAILLSTHDLDLALRSCDSLWLMTNTGVQVGTPEDLVLNNHIEKTFADGRSYFDKRTGSFLSNAPAQSSVYVEGDGIPHVWTRRALQRHHFALSDVPTSINIQIDNYDTPLWTLKIDEQVTIHESIQSVLSALEEQHERDTTLER